MLFSDDMARTNLLRKPPVVNLRKPTKPKPGIISRIILRTAWDSTGQLSRAFGTRRRAKSASVRPSPTRAPVRK